MKHLTLIFILLPCLVIGQIPDPIKGTYVNDLAHVLHTEDIAAMNKQLRTIETTYTVQMAVVIINDLPAGMAIEDYARAIGRKWHVGNARNGLVYAIALNDKKQRLEVAANLEGTIPDAVALHLTDGVKGYYRAGKLGDGILNMLYEIENRLKPVKAEQQQLGATELIKKNTMDPSTIVLLCIFALCGIPGIILAILHFRLKRKKRKIAEEEQAAAIWKKTQDAIHLNQQIVNRHNGRSTKPLYSINAEPQIRPVMKKEEPITPDPVYVPPIIVYEAPEDNTPKSSSNDSYSSRSDDSSNSSSYGDWGSGSSDNSSSSDSGYSGGGASNDL